MRKKGKKGTDSVELNLAAMLDMAFQLLTFFILTFKPGPVEGQIKLVMPPPQSITPLEDGKSPGTSVDNLDPFKGIESLVISVAAAKDGTLGSMQLGRDLIGSLSRLDDRLREILSNPKSGKNQVLISVDSRLSYGPLMSVVDVCTRQFVYDKDGRQTALERLSFVEMVTE